VEGGLAAGNVWVVDADIASFFDSVPHRRLFGLLREWLPEPRLYALVTACVTAAGPEPGLGIAQGAPLSPLLANVYLDRFDAAMTAAGYRLIRYADDFVVLCPTRQQAELALRQAAGLLRGLGLSLNPNKTRIVHRDEGFTFLGYTFDRHGKRPGEEALRGLQIKLRLVADPEARRRVVAGWQGYFGPAGGTGAAPSVGPAAEDPALEAYRRRFLGRADIFGRCWRRAGRSGYTPVRRLPADADL
jgi:hypothetical protein